MAFNITRIHKKLALTLTLSIGGAHAMAGGYADPAYSGKAYQPQQQQQTQQRQSQTQSRQQQPEKTNNQDSDAAQYLKSVAEGTRLIATKCPDGEGKYYATGKRPRIKPEVVSCVDVHFRAYCPGNRDYSDVIAHNFIEMSGCFGDTYDIDPKPDCKVDQVQIEVIDARACGGYR